MAIKISKGKGFYCWLIAVLILVTFITSLTHAEESEPIAVSSAKVDETIALHYYQGTEYINFEDIQFPIFSPPEYNVKISPTPSAIDPTSKNPNSVSDIEVTVTNDSGTPVRGVNLTLTSTGGEIANELGTTGYYGTFNTGFTSSDSGTFSINVSGYNFIGSDSARITVLNTDPTAKFKFSPSNTNVASTVTFDASDSNDIDGTIDDYSWDFGDGTSGKGEEISHTYQKSGEFTPSLTVTDNLGDKDTFSSSSKIIVTNPNERASMKVLMSSNPASVDTGKQSTITVTVKGDDGKDIPGAIVKLTTNIGDVNPTTEKTDEFGQLTSTFTSSVEGKATINAQVKKDGFSDNSSMINVHVQPPTAPKVSVSSEPSSVNPEKPSTITVIVKGNDGKEISGAIVELDSDLGKVVPKSGETDTFGKFTSNFTSPTEGTATIDVKVNAPDYGETKDETKVKVTHLEIPNVQVSSEPQSIEINNTSTITVTVIGEDGKEIPKAKVELELNPIIGKVVPKSGETNSSGQFTSIFTSSAEGTTTITAKVNKNGFGDNSNETELLVKPLKISDANNSSEPNIPNSSDNVLLRLLNSLLGNKEDGSKSLAGDNNNGSKSLILIAISAFLFALIGIGKKSLGGKPTDQGKKEETVTIEAVPVEAGFDIQIEPASIPADGESTAKVIIKLKDDKGNLIKAQNDITVELSTSLGIITSPVKILSGEMTVTATLTSGHIAGTAEIEISSSSLKEKGKTLYEDIKVIFTIPGPDETGFDIKIEPESIPANGKATAEVTIRILDKKGNFINSPNEKTVELLTTLGNITSPVKFMPGESKVTAILTSGEVPGTAEIKAISSLKGEIKALHGNGKITFTKVEPDKTGFDIQIKPESIPADEKSTATVIIRIKDEKGNFVQPPNEIVVELSTTLGTITSPIKILPYEQEGTATITSGPVGVAKVVASSGPLKEGGKNLKGEGKVSFI